MKKPTHIESTDEKASDGSYKHKYKCSCGNIFLTLPRRIKSGQTKSCGCLKKAQLSEYSTGRTPQNALKDPTESSFGSLWHSYKRNARVKGHEFNLTKEEFRKLTKSNCHYCGCEPYVERTAQTAREGYLYNGIDRKDNDEGYTLENSLTCCGTCNFLKRDLIYDEFINQCILIAKSNGRWDGKVWLIQIHLALDH